MRIRVDKADLLFAQVLERLIPNTARLRVVEESFREAWSLRNSAADADRTRLRAQLLTLQQQKRRTLQLAVDGSLSAEEFRPVLEELKANIATLEIALSDAEAANQELDCDTAWGYLEHLLFNQHLLWMQTDTAEKRRIAKLIFPFGIRCSKEGFGTPVTHSLFSILADENVPREELVALTTIEEITYIVDYK